MGAGAVVELSRGDVTFLTLIAPNSYAGAHGMDAIIGTLGFPVELTVQIPVNRPIRRAIAATTPRTIETFNC